VPFKKYHEKQFVAEFFLDDESLVVLIYKVKYYLLEIYIFNDYKINTESKKILGFTIL